MTQPGPRRLTVLRGSGLKAPAAPAAVVVRGGATASRPASDAALPALGTLQSPFGVPARRRCTAAAAPASTAASTGIARRRERGNHHALRLAGTACRAAPGIAALELTDPASGDLPAFQAGAFIDVRTPYGVRAYSLCNAPSECRRYVILVRSELHGRDGSAWLHDEAAEDLLQVRPPRNEFPLARHAVHSLLVACGVGVAPLCAMAHALWRRAAPFELHYSCRNSERAAWRNELARSPYAARLHFHWSESRGRLDLAALLSRTPPGADV